MAKVEAEFVDKVPIPHPEPLSGGQLELTAAMEADLKRVAQQDTSEQLYGTLQELFARHDAEGKGELTSRQLEAFLHEYFETVENKVYSRCITVYLRRISRIFFPHRVHLGPTMCCVPDPPPSFLLPSQHDTWLSWVNGRPVALPSSVAWSTKRMIRTV